MTEPRDASRRLEDRLGHRFRDAELLARALTHASARDGHNERLEFLGDAVLNLVVAEVLFVQRPDHREGELTERKALLVSRATLDRVGRRLGLAEHVVTGGSLAERGSLPKSVLGNALEALLGAIYLDTPAEQRLEHAAACVRAWLAPEFARLEAAHARARAKSRLQNWSQKRHGCLPEYPVLDHYEHPESHAFLVAAVVANRRFPAAWGSTKKEAERLAAWEALLELGEEAAE